MKIILYLAVFALFFSGCKDIMSENITGKTPVMIIPTNGQTVPQNPVHFKWESLKGATKYQLQVVSPSFSNISIYALDTIITGTEFYFPLDSNNYELKLTALNSGYTSNALTGIFFTVNTANNGGGTGSLILETPLDQAYFRSVSAFQRTFKWKPVLNISHYEFYLKKGTSFASGTVVSYFDHLNLPNANISDTITFREGEYHWGVRAYLANGFETPITKRNFYIDTTRPNIPVLVSPGSTQTPGNITFVWDNGTDPGDVHAPVNSTIEVSDSPTFASNNQIFTIQGTTKIIPVIGIGMRYWRVRNKDEAGNQSAYSPRGEFSLM